MILGARDEIADAEILQGLQIDRNPRQVLDARLQIAHDGVRIGVSLGVWFELDHHPPAVERGVRAVDADERGDAGDGGILEQGGHQGLLALGHGLEGNGLGASEIPWMSPVSWGGRKPFGIST